MMWKWLYTAEKESDEHTAHKHKHYDSESVRQYIAKQKAQRQQQKEAQRKAEMEEAQKRQQLMQDLIAKQKSAAMSSKVEQGADPSHRINNSIELFIFSFLILICSNFIDIDLILT